MKVGDLIRFRPDLPWIKDHHVGILIKFTPSNHWVSVYWPGVDNGLTGVHLAKELEVISATR